MFYPLLLLVTLIFTPFISYSEDVDHIKTHCENIPHWYISQTSDIVYYPPNKKKCVLRESFKDANSAEFALYEAKRKFIKAASEYSGKAFMSYELVEDGELTEEINISFCMNEINAKCSIIERKINKMKPEYPWNVVVECQARVNKKQYKKYVKELAEKALNNSLTRYDLKKGSEYINTSLKNESIHRKERLNNYEELRDYFDWVEFDKNSLNANKESEFRLNYFTKSSNPIVNRQSNIKQTKYLIDKYNIEEAIDKIKMLINRGEDTAELRNKLGVAYWKAAYTLSLAEAEFKKALELNPSNDLKRQILYNLSTVLGMQGKYKESLNLLENYSNIDKDGRILRSTIRSRLSQQLICNDLKEACGNDKSGICQNWNNALLNGDCLESGDSTVKDLHNTTKD